MDATEPTDFVVVLTTLPDGAKAKAMVRTLVHQRMAACGTVIEPVTSIFRWEGTIEESTETQVLLKTHRDRLADLQSAIQDLHPYDVPELLALPVLTGLTEYLAWIRAETAHGEAA